MNRIADLTWKHPKLVLAAVGAFALLAIVVGRDVESHLEGRRASPTRPPRASGPTPSCATRSATTRTRAIVVVVRAPDGGQLDLARPGLAARGRPAQRRDGRGRYVGRVVNPLSDRAPPGPSSPATASR